MKMRTSWMLVLSVAVLWCNPLNAQLPVGNPPFSTQVGGTIDSINVSSLNLHVDIPIHGRAGRGIAFQYNLSYDNSIWSPQFVNNVNTWQPIPNWGWRGIAEAFSGYITYQQNGTGPLTCTNPALGQTIEYYAFVYHDPSGVQHSAPNMLDTAGCLAGTHTVQSTADGSGYSIDVSISGGIVSGMVHSSSGGLMVVPTQFMPNARSVLPPPIASGTLQDSNGNQISMNVSGSSVNFIDTLGTNALTIDSSNPSAVKYTYTGPDGTPTFIVVNYAQYTVQTNFGATDSTARPIAEYPPTAVMLISSVVFPDSSTYTLTYEPTPGTASNVTGRLASITLPYGGQVQYAYTGGFNGISADGTTPGITRTLGASQWSYARNVPNTGPSTTTLSDPEGNQIAYTFSGMQELQRQVYQGSILSGTLLLTQLSCYNGNTSNCATASVSSPITSTDIFTQLPGGLESLVETHYDSLGNPTEVDQYGYDTGKAGPLLRKIATVYTPLSNFITGKPSSVTVTDASGAIASQTLFNYDETGVTSTSALQHVAVSGSRGNLTSIKQMTARNFYLTKTFSYYDTGSLNSYVDVNGATITYNYDAGSCNGSYPTHLSLPLGLSLSTAWSCLGGVNTSSTDENQNTTNYLYNTVSDPHIWRVKQRTDPLGNVHNTIYGVTTNEEVMSFNGGNSSVDVLATFDSYGRTSTAQIRQTPGGTTFDTLESDYDTLGRKKRATTPYAGTAGQTNSTVGATITTFDALNRTLQRTQASGGFIKYVYNGTNDILAQTGPAPAGEQLKQKQLEYDALGRLTSVCEISAISGSGACGQNTPATGFLTRYTYDSLDNILTVTQNAQSSSPQVRSFQYDAISRRVSESAPESGTVNYLYDTDPTGGCATSNPGDLVRRVDAAGISTCYIYDARRRMVSAVSSGIGLVTISGSERNTQVLTHAATQATGSVAINGIGTANVLIQGGRQSKVDTGDCRLINHVWVCTTIYDHGNVYLTVNGVQETCSYNQTLNISSSSIAACLSSALSNDPNSPVSATVSGSTITMRGRTPNSSPYYSFSVTTSFDGADFSSPSYTGNPSSGALAVGDSGTVSITLNNVVKSTTYQLGSSPTSIATALAQAFAGDPDVTVSSVGNTINFTSTQYGFPYNYVISSSSTTQSFTGSALGLSGGTDNIFGTSFDTGNVSITAGSSTASVSYGQNDTPFSIATNIAAAINASSTFPATASALPPARVELVAKSAGTISLSSASSSTNPNFTGVSFVSQSISSTGIDQSRQTRFVYDAASVNGQTMANSKGRLAEAITCIADCVGTNVITDLGFSYDAVGNISDTYESTPHSGGYYHLHATYWPHDRLNTLGGLAGLPTFTFIPDGEGRISAISASSGQNPVTATTFNSASQVTGVTFGSGDSDTYSIDATTGRMTQFKASINNQNFVGALTWNASGSLGALNISDPFNSSANQSCSYSYDDFARLASVNCGTVWSQTFNYDPFGNIAKTGSFPFQPTYSTTSNRIQALPGASPSYNANGALLNDGMHSYAWDAQGNLSSVDSVGLVYDAMGRMVEQSRGTSYTQIVYSPTGDKIALMNGQLLQKAFIGLPGGATAVYGGSGLAYYQHPDWLGSSRIASTPSRAMYADSSYAPFGEPYAPGGSSDISFTHEHQDTVLGLYDFLYREYSSTQGRWISCDPIGSAVADSADPQTWNKYSYSRNNPLSLIDPSGLDELPPCKDLIIMGIKDTSTLDGKDKNGDMAAVQELAKSWGYNVAFPYSNMGAMSSILDVFHQGQGATTAATKDAQEALQYTINNGGTTVINFSGAAQAYASAMAQFNSSAGTAGASGKIENVIYLSPGTGGSQLVTGTQSTERYNGGGIADMLTNLTAPEQAGIVNSGALDHCKHNAKCELENYLKDCGEACKNSPCNSQIFARNHKGPRDNPGGSPRPPDQPGYNIGERCSVGPESGCMDFVYWSWGDLFSNENPGGRGSGFWHPPFW